jgi:hypothetical protein
VGEEPEVNTPALLLALTLSLSEIPRTPSFSAAR